MNIKDIYKGNILICTKYEPSDAFSSSLYAEDTCWEYDLFSAISIDTDIYKQNATLIKTPNKGYIDIDNINNIFDYLYFIKEGRNPNYELGRNIIPSYAYEKNCLFVDTDSLRPYFDFKNQTTLKSDDISIRKLKRLEKSFK